MEALDAIRSRRTTKSFGTTPVPREVIEQILDAAGWAPNHKLTQPWTFTVLEGPARMAFASLRRALAARDARKTGAHEADVFRLGEEAAAKVLRAPTVILVSCVQRGDEVHRDEDLVATAAAIQNMLIAATSLGIGTFWSSGPIAYQPEVRELFDLDPSDKIVGIVQVGYSEDQPTPKRPPAAASTRWPTVRDVPYLVSRVQRLVGTGNGVAAGTHKSS